MAANANATTNVEMKAHSEAEKVNEDNKAVEEVQPPNQDTFEALVEKANTIYSQEPVFTLDTKTKLLKELLKLHTVSVGTFTKSTIQGTLSLIFTETSTTHESSVCKPGYLYWVNNRFCILMNYSDIHQAIAEISAKTNIRFSSIRTDSRHGYLVHYPNLNRV